MKKPKISVVLPVFNAEKYIGAAIQSVLDQSFADFELIIVDDASTDSTPLIINTYAKSDSRIKVITNKKNLYIAQALNKGISHAKSAVIARMDADDICLPQRFKRQYWLLTQNPNVAVVGCNIIIIDEDGNEIGKRKYYSDSDMLKKRIFRYSPFAHPTTMFRKAVFDESGGYDPKWSPSEDIDLWIKIGKKYEFANIQDFEFKYRVFSDSHSNKKLRKVELMTIQLRYNAATRYGYKGSIGDIFYNIVELLTVYLIPVTFRYKLFNLVRNKGII